MHFAVSSYMMSTFLQAARTKLMLNWNIFCSVFLLVIFKMGGKNYSVEPMKF